MTKSTLAGAATIALLMIAARADAATASTTRSWDYKQASPATLEVDNLVGDVRIERASSAGFQVSVTVTGEAGSEREAREIVDAVEFEVRDTGHSPVFQVMLPKSRFPLVYYPDAPDGWFAGRASVDYLGEKRRVTGHAGDGVKVRVDILVRAPAEARLEVRNVFGDATAEGFSGDLSLDGTSGHLTSRNGTGRLNLDSGSGAIDVATHSGEVRADTGSGPVTVRDCECRISADTGSGGVSVMGGKGRLDADTGSGGVVVENFSGSVRADTGSGSVKVSGLDGEGEFVADTGSGGVRVSGDLSGMRRLDIDTGSGGVTIEASAWPAMELVVDTGSGGSDFDVPGATVRTDDDRQIVSIGERGFRGMIDTGSGSVHLRTIAATGP